MTHAHEAAATRRPGHAGADDAAPPCAKDTPEAGALRELDEAMRGMRRLTMRPPEVAITLPTSGRRIDFAKLLACSAIGGLCGVATDEAPVTVKSVAQALDLDHSTVSRLLGEIEGEGLIERSPHPNDRRSTVLSLTDQGRTVIAGFEQARLQFLGRLLEDWPEQDVQTLAVLLGRLVDTATQRRELMERWIHEESGSGQPSPA